MRASAARNAARRSTTREGMRGAIEQVRESGYDARRLGRLHRNNETLTQLRHIRPSSKGPAQSRGRWPPQNIMLRQD